MSFPDRGLVDLQDFRDFAAGELFKVPQLQDFAVGVRQLVERLSQSGFHFNFDQAAIRRGDRSRDLLGEPCGRFFGQMVQRAFFAGDTAALSQEMALVESNEMFPGQTAKPGIEGEGAFGEVIGQVLGGLRQRLLNDIGWIKSRQQTAIEAHGDHPPQSIPIAVQQLSASVGIAALGFPKKVTGVRHDASRTGISEFALIGISGSGKDCDRFFRNCQFFGHKSVEIGKSEVSEPELSQASAAEVIDSLSGEAAVL